MDPGPQQQPPPKPAWCNAQSLLPILKDNTTRAGKFIYCLPHQNRRAVGAEGRQR